MSLTALLLLPPNVYTTVCDKLFNSFCSLRRNAATGTDSSAVEKTLAVFYNNFGLRTGSEDSPTWQVADSMILATIMGIDIPERRLDLKFKTPADIFSAGSRDVLCSSGEFVTLKKDMSGILYTGDVALNNVFPGDLVYSFCMDEKCASIGKICVFVSGR